MNCLFSPLSNLGNFPSAFDTQSCGENCKGALKSMMREASDRTFFTSKRCSLITDATGWRASRDFNLMSQEIRGKSFSEDQEINVRS